jgi:hypothetical protein
LETTENEKNGRFVYFLGEGEGGGEGKKNRFDLTAWMDG